MKFKTTFILCALLSIFFSCNDQHSVELPVEGLDAESMAYIDNAIAELEADNDQPNNQEASNRAIVYVDAGSKDAIADAIAEAGVNGKVVLKNGNHYVTKTIEVTYCVKISGEQGAVIISSIPLQKSTLEPIFYVHDAPYVHIQDLEIESDNSSPNTVSVLLDNAHFARISGLKMTGFFHGIVVDYSNLIRIYDNTFQGNPEWTSFVGVTVAILVINGQKNKIYNNTTTNAVFGVLAGGEKGVIYENAAYGCAHGIGLIEVPKNATVFPDYVSPFTEETFGWTIKDNVGQFNGWGCLVGAGAKKSYVYNNDFSNNQWYDVELAGETNRFQFFVAETSERILFSAGRYQEVRVKDCGKNNQTFGGIKVDTGIEPCF